MATVMAQVGGGPIKTLNEVGTVAAVKEALGVPEYTALVDGIPVEDSYELSDNQFVSLAAAAKAG